MWPFRRSSRHPQPRGGPDSPFAGMEAATQREDQPPGLDRRKSGRGSRRERKASRDVKKLEKRRRTYSFDPGRDDTIQVGRNNNPPPVPALPTGPFRATANNRLNQRDPTAPPPGQKPLRATTMPPGTASQDWQRVPTLHKRSGQDLPRRKSSKKRKEQHDREAEIRAMVPTMPTRAVTDAGFGRLSKKESKKMREGPNRRGYNLSSDVSLPSAGSAHSSQSSESEQRGSYWLHALDALTPRPTIRYSHNPRHVHSGSGLEVSSSESPKRRVLDMEMPEETFQSRKRIADLADELDASELRELMERDQKRREKKQIANKIKAERRLARQQEKQREQEDAAVRAGTPPPPNLERGVLGREIADSGSGTSAVVTSSRQRYSQMPLNEREKHPAAVFHPDDPAIRSEPPIQGAEFPANEPRDQPIPATESVTPTVQTQVDAPPAAPAPKPNASATSVQQAQGPSGPGMPPVLDLYKTKQSVPSEKSASSRRTSETGGRPPRSWTSFFTRRSKEKRSSTPLSFSNTIRDQAEVVPASTAATYTPVWQPSQVPKRTMSKFREDLPELPLSPPDSRVQSPETEPILPLQAGHLGNRNRSSIQAEHPLARYDTPTSGHRSMDALRQTAESPTSVQRSIDAASPESEVFVAQSLASIDSEGSWLSGRRGGSKRKSIIGAVNAYRESQGSLQKAPKDYSESIEELGIAEDEYFSRLTPSPEDRSRINRRSGASAGDPMPSSDDEEGGSLVSPANSENTKWGAVARHPTIVHRSTNARSREGLLNEYAEGEICNTEKAENSPTDSKGKSSISSGVEEDYEEPVRRATSIDLGKGHVRRISAGSAKLLDLKPKVAESSRS